MREGNRLKRRSALLILCGILIGYCLAILPDYLEFHYQQQRNVKPYETANESNSTAQKLYQEVRILCWIMTSPKNHQAKAIHLKRTWGKRCNKLLFMSSKKDEQLNSIALPVREGRDHLWAKTKEAFKYIYEHHRSDADWFFKADDDTYAIMENMRYLLYSYSSEMPIYFGCKFKPYVKQGYMSGGAGYVLSREALKRLVEKALPNPKLCRDSHEGFEDVEIGKCLENVQVIAGDSRDSQKRGRFFPVHVNDFLIKERNATKHFWHEKFSYYNSTGLGSSDYAISFHYIKPDEMYDLDYFTYHLRPYGIVHKPDELPKKLSFNEIEYRTKSAKSTK